MVQRTSIKLDASLDIPLDQTVEDRDGEPVVTSTDFQEVTGLEELSQSIRVRLSLLRGESPFFPEAGLPLRDMVQKLDPREIETIVRNEVLKEPLVSSVPIVDVDITDLVVRIAVIRIRYIAVTGEEGSVEVTV